MHTHHIHYMLRYTSLAIAVHDYARVCVDVYGAQLWLTVAVYVPARQP